MTVPKVHFPVLKCPHTIKKIDSFILKKLIAITIKRKEIKIAKKYVFEKLPAGSKSLKLDFARSASSSLVHTFKLEMRVR
jgi:hypothetical protein